MSPPYAQCPPHSYSSFTICLPHTHTESSQSKQIRQFHSHGTTKELSIWGVQKTSQNYIFFQVFQEIYSYLPFIYRNLQPEGKFRASSSLRNEVYLTQFTKIQKNKTIVVKIVGKYKNKRKKLLMFRPAPLMYARWSSLLPEKATNLVYNFLSAKANNHSFRETHFPKLIESPNESS